VRRLRLSTGATRLDVPALELVPLVLARTLGPHVATARGFDADTP
jgi:hypothetical protein